MDKKIIIEKRNIFISILYLLISFFVVDYSLTSNVKALEEVNLTYNFDYTGAVQKFTAPYSGEYFLEVWGAQGGKGLNTVGGNGGYASGKVNLRSGQEIYIYVGGAGGKPTAGFNGGGAGGIDTGSSQNGGGGGGATDIRINGSTLTNRVIVAGGGAGGGRDGATGVGGGLSGTASANFNNSYAGQPGTQLAGGNAYTTSRKATNGSLGLGGNGSTGYNSAGGGGGGGGYYGGGGGTSTANHGSGYSAGGGGGSSYIGGVTGGVTYAGNQSMPNPFATTTIVQAKQYLSANNQSLQNYNFDYTGNYQTFVAPYSGEYKLEVWGAQGGTGAYQGGGYPGGKGGYATGNITLNAGDTLYVYVGGVGTVKNDNRCGGSGGGATDIRLKSGSWNDAGGLNSRIIVAGGGPGTHGSSAYSSGVIGVGGGSTGTVSYYSGKTSSNPATQTAGGADNGNSNAFNSSYEENGMFGMAGMAIKTPTSFCTNGGFNGGGKSNSWVVGGGGGGWYGGATVWPQGGGGSGYVLTETSYKPSGYTPTQKYYLKEAYMLSGNQTMPDPYSLVNSNTVVVYAKNYLEANNQSSNPTYTFDYNGSYHIFSAPYTGQYQLEVWGAQGGNSTNGIGGKGGYSSGKINLNSNTKLYVYVGSAGGTTSFGSLLPGGYNGGGNAKDWGSTAKQGAGGGATDIRLTVGTWNAVDGLNSRLIVAGGGGGAAGYTKANINGGYGGGTTGGPGADWSSSEAGGNGGTQTAAGSRRGTSDTAINGGFGYGGYTNGSTVNSGGGGGWYGGAYGSRAGSGGGGSGYAVTQTSHKPANYSVDSGYYMTETVVTAGNQTMPLAQPMATGTMVGKSGNGYARITALIPLSDDSSLKTLSIDKGVLDKPFDKDTYVYNLTLGTNDTSINISAEVNEENATIAQNAIGLIENIKAGNSTHNIIVTAHDGSISVYTINIYREPSTYKYLQDLTINGVTIEGFAPEKLNYTINYPYNADRNIEIVASKRFPSQVIVGGGQFRLVSGMVQTIEVTPEDGSLPAVYTINFNLENSSKLKKLEVTNLVDIEFTPEFNENALEYELEVPYYVITLDIIGEAYDDGAHISISGNGYLKIGRNKVTITVTAPNVAPTVYQIDVVRTEEDGGYVGSRETDFNYTGGYQTFTAPVTGRYKLEVWGAQGGTGGNQGGKGGYSTAIVTLQKDQQIYIYVGGQGSSTSEGIDRYSGNKYAGGFNGGAYGSGSAGAGGGGATDIRLISGAWNNANGLNSRLIVAGGGGGGGAAINPGGHGGNTTNLHQLGTGQPGIVSPRYNSSYNNDNGGGGGGYYGGKTVAGDDTRRAYGGSSYVTSLKDYDVEASQMINGVSTMPNPSGGYTTGKTGHGFARVTSLKPLSPDNFLSRIDLSIGNLIPEFNMETLEYDVTLPANKTRLTVRGVTADPYATIVGNKEYVIPSGVTPISLVVTAENGDVRTYTINVHRPMSSEGLPNDIVISGLVPSLCATNDLYCNLDPTFDPEIGAYTITVPSRIKELEFTVVRKHEFQSVIGEGKKELEGGEDNIVNIEVSSEDGVNKTYYDFYITRDMTGNNDLDSLTINDPVREINFDPGITEYFISVPNEYTSIDYEAVLSDPNATKVETGNENFVVGLNTIEIAVKAANGDEKSYYINVYREQSGNTFLKNLEVKSGDEIFAISPVFNKILNTYTVTVPNEIDSINIIATADDNTTTVVGGGIKNLTVGTNNFTINTTAQNQNKGSYKLSVIRLRSSNNYLKQLSAAEGSFDQEFNKDVLEYSITVEPHIKSLNLTALALHDKASVTITNNRNFKGGENIVKVTVTAEDKTKREYIIKVTKLVSENNYLSSLNTNVYDMTNIFKKDVYEYNIGVENNVSSLTITATKEDPLSTLAGTGKYNLRTGTNTIIVSVTSESGVLQTYTINVIRALNSNTYLSNITNNQGGLLSPVFNKETVNYTMNVRNEVSNITINGIPEVSTTRVNGNGLHNLVEGENTITLLTTAENGEFKTYTIVITRDKSANANLKKLFIHGALLTPNFDKSIISYTTKVGNDINSLTIDALPEDPNASIQIIGNENFVLGENTVIVRVTPKSGAQDAKDYTIKVIKQDVPSSSNELSGITVNKGTLTPTFDPKKQLYNVTVENTDTTITVNATKAIEAAVLTGTGSYNLVVGENLITLKVVSTDGIEKVYQIIVTRKESSDTRLSRLTVKDSVLNPSFSPTTYNYALNTYSKALELDIKTNHPNATYEVIGNQNLVNGVNIIKVKVTAENKVDTQEYMLTVTKDPSNNNNLSSLSVRGYNLTPNFNKVVTLYQVNVEYDVNTVIIDALLEDDTATLNNRDEVSLDVGENIVDVEVTSESGILKTYTIIINRAGSPNNYLSDIILSDGELSPTFNRNTLNYEVLVPYEVESIDINAIKDSEAATVTSGNGSHDLNVGNNLINIIVKAENNTTRTYTVNVKRHEIVTSRLRDIKIKNYEFDIPFNSDIFDYNVTIDNEVTALDLTILKLDPSSTYQIIGNNNFVVGMNVVTVLVTSSDTVTTSTYTINVNRQMQSNTYLAYISLSNGFLTPTFVKETLTYNVSVGNDIDSITISSEALVGSATVTGNGTYNLNTGDNLIKLIVTSNSGVKRTYFINVNRSQSNNNLLTNLVVKLEGEIQTLNPIFDPNVNNYSLNVPLGTSRIVIEASTTSPAKLTGTGTKDLVAGVNNFQLAVTSESGIVNTYNIAVNRPASTNNHLTNIIPSVGTLTPSFSYNTEEYTLNLNSSASFLSFQVDIEDRYATVSGIDRMLVPDGTSVRQIVVKAENNTTRTYTININKERSDDARLASLSLAGYEFNEPFDPENTIYTVTVPSSKKHILPSEVSATLMDPNATMTKDNALSLSPIADNIYRVNVTAPDGYTKKTYEIRVVRERGSDDALASLSVNIGSLDKAFNPNVLEYTWSLNAGTTLLTSSNVLATPSDVYATVIKTSSIDLTTPGNRTYEITVTSHDETNTRTYLLHVVVLASADNKLSSITPSKGSLTPNFNPNTLDYIINVEDTTEEINISATLSNESATIVSGVGNYVLNDYETIIEIIVRAEDFSERKYTLKVRKSIVTLLNLNNIEFNNYNQELCNLETKECTLEPVFNSDTLDYTFKVPNEIGSVGLLISKAHVNQGLKVYNNDLEINPNNISLLVGTNNIKIVVSNDLGQKREYKITVTRMQSGNNYLSSLRVIDPNIDIEFDKNTLEYFIEVDHHYEEIGLEYTTEHDKATVSVTNNRFFMIGNNDILIRVRAENRQVREYIIHVFRKPSYNNYLQKITVSTGVIYPLTPVFNKTTFSYSATVGSNVTKVTLEGVVDDITTIVEGNGEKELKTGNNIFNLITMAETGELQTYTINIIRQRDTNVYLKGLSVANYQLNEDFNKEKFKYTLDVPSTVNSLNITAIPDDPTASVTIRKNENFKTGKNTVSIIVVSRDLTSSRTYFLEVNKLKSANNLLSNISLNEGTVPISFNPNTNIYNLRVPTELSSIDIVGITSDNLAFVEGNGTYSLLYGNNTINLEVYAENGSRNLYTLNIFREYNNYLYSLQVDSGILDPIFNKNTLNYKVEVNSAIEEITINGIKEEITSTITGNGTYPLVNGDNIFSIVVSSIDGTSKTYTINVHKLSSSNNLIKSLEIREGILSPEFNKNVYQYETMISNEHPKATFEITLDDSNARYEIIGNENLVLGDNEVIVRVTAQNGDKLDYIINVIKQPAELFSNKLSSLKVDKGSLSPSFKPNIYSYIVTVDNNVNDITITAVRESADAKISGTGKHILDYGRNRIMVTVTSKDGIIRNYEIIVNRALSSDARLKELSFKEGNLMPIFSRNNRNYTINVDSNVNKLTPTIEPVIEGTTYEIIGNNNFVLGENTVTIKTVAANGKSTFEYTIKVNKMLSLKNRLLNLTSNFGTLTPSFNSDLGGPYIINVEKNINSIILSGVLEDSESHVVGLGLHELKNATNYISVVVTSPAGLVKTYNVIVNKELVDDSSLSLLQVSEGILSPSFNKDVLDYTVDVSNDIEIIRLTALPTMKNAIVTGAREYSLAVGDNLIKVIVESPNGSKRTYNVTVKRASVVSSKIVSLKINEGILSPEFSPDVLSYEVYVPSEIESIEPIIVLEDINATYEVAGNTDFKIGSNIMKVKVTSSDLVDTTTYEINVVRQINSNNFLTYLATNVGALSPEFNKTTLNYTVNVGNDIENITIYGGAEDGKASVSGLGTYYNLKTGENIFPVTVRSQTGVVRTYFVNVIRALSDNNLLQNLIVKNSGEGLTLNPVFNPNHNEYTLEVESGVKNLNIEALALDNVDIIGTGEIELTGEETVIRVTTTSESGLVNNYTITVTKLISTNADIIDIIPSSGNLNIPFDNNIKNYEMTVEDAINRLSFDVKLVDDAATVVGNEELPLNYGVNNITITVTAEDNVTTNTINIIVTRKKALLNVILSKDSVILAPNQSETITLTFDPMDADNKEFVWVSYDSAIATVNNGIITAVNPGATIIELTNVENPIMKKQVIVNVIPLQIESGEYEIRRLDGVEDIVIGIKDRVKITDFIEKFDNEPEILKVYDKDNNLVENMNGYIKTGMIIKLEIGGVVYDSLRIIVRGDINGDGIVDISDVAMTEDHVIFKDIKTGYVLYAMDVIDFGNIDISDVSRIEDYVIFKIDTLN